MRKTVFGCLGAAAVAFALQLTVADVQAGFFNRCDPCEPAAFAPCDAAACDPCGPNIFNGCLPNGNGNGRGFFITGHLEGGLFANGHGNRSTYTGPGSTWANPARGHDYMSGNTDLLQNTRLTHPQMNQVYLSMGRAVNSGRGLDIGGTMDFAFGSDVYNVQSRGMEYGTGRAGGGRDAGRWGSGDYFSAIPQMYTEIAFDRWNVKAGKFYLPFGSSSFKSTDNFFYSWAPNKLITPTTGGGMLTTFKVNNRLSVISGWTNGLDQFGETSKDNAFLGGFDFSPTSRVNVRYVFAAGKDTYALGRSQGWERQEYFIHSLVTTTQLTNRLKYVFDWTYNQSKEWAGVRTNQYNYGLNNELIFQANNRWAFGTRFGMLRAAPLLEEMMGYPISAKAEWYTVSLGANWTPNRWLTVKPELRYDWTNKGDATQRSPFNYGVNTYQVSGGMSAVVSF